MKYKHGMRVTCTIRGEQIYDAKISINEDGEIFICQNIKDGFSTYNKLGYTYSWCVEEGTDEQLKYNDVENLKALKPSLDTLEIGDIINHEGSRAKILGRIGDLIFRSCLTDFDTYSTAATIKQLKDDGWEVETDCEGEDVEMTVGEIAEKLGIDPTNLKIVD